jgi:hypothetical protein
MVDAHKISYALHTNAKAPTSYMLIIVLTNGFILS